MSEVPLKRFSHLSKNRECAEAWDNDMITYISLVIMFFFCCGGIVFGYNAGVVHIDRGGCE